MRIAVFRTGRHTDSKGNERQWTEADLDRIAAGYDPKSHEAPVVIGHPKENAPAYGWVKGLEREGDMLYAHVEPTVPEFQGWLKAGLFKKRSISLYPDMTLRHVGFLGAMPPAVKGLPDFAFAENGDRSYSTYETHDYADGEEEHAARAAKHGIGMKVGGNRTKPGKYAHVPDDEFGDPVNYRYPLDEEHIHAALAYWAKPHNRDQYSKEEVEKITSRILAAAKKHGVEVDKDKFKFMEGGSRMSFWEELKAFLKGKGVDVGEPESFTEEQVKAAAAAAVAKAKAEMESSFAEKGRLLSDQESALKAKEAEFAAQAANARKREIADFCEALKKRGVLTPAMEKVGMGITSFMQAIAAIETTYEFAEKPEAGLSRQTPLEFMRAFLGALPPSIVMREFADNAGDPGGGDYAERRERAITQHMEKQKTDYRTAFLAVSKERPELFELERR